MSKFLVSFLVCFLISIHCTFAQDYVPMAVENATWVVGVAPDGWDDIYYHGYKIEGDTSINGIDYKKVYGYDLEDFTGYPYQIESKYFFGVIRDDIQEKKVYGTPGYVNDACFSVPLPEEVLLFDFSKTVDDTISLCAIEISLDDMPVICYEDTINDHYGYERRTLNTGAIEIIEGIGSNQGPFETLVPFIHAGFGHGLFYYCIGNNFDCGLHTSVSNLIAENDISLYPNPTSDRLNVETDLEVKDIQVFNLLGKLVSNIRATDSIDLSRYQTGTYLVVVELADDKFYRSRVFKN